MTKLPKLTDERGHTVRCDGCGDPAVIEDHATGFAYCQHCHDQNAKREQSDQAAPLSDAEDTA